jgi:hypothetical protein
MMNKVFMSGAFEVLTREKFAKFPLKFSCSLNYGTNMGALLIYAHSIASVSLWTILLGLLLYHIFQKNEISLYFLKLPTHPNF